MDALARINLMTTPTKSTLTGTNRNAGFMASSIITITENNLHKLHEGLYDIRQKKYMANTTNDIEKLSVPNSSGKMSNDG